MQLRTILLLVLFAAFLPATAPCADNGELWGSAAMSDSDPYVGQQITYTFSIHHTVPVRVGTFQPPDFTGFHAKAYPVRETVQRTLHGKEYGVTEIHYVLVPLTPGRRTIQSAEVTVGIIRPGQEQQVPFDGFFSDPLVRRDRVERRVVRGPALAVHIQPLPSIPEDFSGLIGRFDLMAAMEATHVNAGDSTTLIVTLQGEGNLMDARPPPLALPETIRAYADGSEEAIELTPHGYRGVKIFRTILVPLQAGTLSVPPVRLTYFDPERRDYRTLVAPLPPVRVHAAASPTAFQDIPEQPPAQALQPHRFRSIALPGTAALIIAGATLLLVRRRPRRTINLAVPMQAKARRMLDAAQTVQGDPEACLGALYHALTAAVLFSAGRTGHALTWKETETWLQSAGWNALEARRAADLLAAIETARYSGSIPDADQCQELLEQTRMMVNKMAC